MKKFISIILAIVLISAFALFALGSGSSGTTSNQGTASAETTTSNNSTLGKYSVVIDSCRLAKDYDGKNVIIVKYVFTNNSNETPTSFMAAMMDKAFQNGIELNSAFMLTDSANYHGDEDSMKDLKAGATLEVEQAYVLNDNSSDVEVEVGEFLSFDNSKVTKTFSIAQ